VEEFELMHRKRIVYRGEVPQAYLLLPILEKGEVYAVLLFENTRQDYRFSEDRLQIAEILADGVSIAWESALMLERISSSQQEWESTFDSISDPIYIVDADYRLRKINRSLASYAMISIKLPRERNCFRHLFHRNTICPWCPVPKSLQSGASITVEAP